MPSVTRITSRPGSMPGRRPPSIPGFLLESPGVPAVPGSSPPCGRWSFQGDHPAALLTGKHDGQAFRMTLTTWRTPDGTARDQPQVHTWTADPFQALRELHQTFTAPPPDGDDLPPFCGGLVGYFGYETAHACEQPPGRMPDPLDVPDLAFMVVDNLIAHDREADRTFLIATGRGATVAAASQDAELGLDDLEGSLLSSPGRRPAPFMAPAGSASGFLRPPGSGALQTPRDGPHPPLQGVQAQFTRDEYRAAVERCRQAILAGRVFEVCLTQQMTLAFGGDPWDLYRVLRHLNPAPMASFLTLPDLAVISASPERFLSLGPERIAESRPIKGTTPRGATPNRDAALRDRLAASAKDRAENVMIVDLVRNDLGRVCEIGSVEVPELCVVESYPTVHQLVSTIRGRLAPQHDALDLVRACFPGGSMTGAPKVEAMKLIGEVELSARGIYSGALGYLDRRGGLDLSIVIRTIICKGGKAWLGTGGAVTADSDPQDEYAETLAKARALLAAIRSVSHH